MKKVIAGIELSLGVIFLLAGVVSGVYLLNEYSDHYSKISETLSVNWKNIEDNLNETRPEFGGHVLNTMMTIGFNFKLFLTLYILLLTIIGILSLIMIFQGLYQFLEN